MSSKGIIVFQFSSVQFSHSVMSDSLRPHELKHDRPPCPSPTPRVHSNSHPSSRWCHPATSSSVVPVSFPPAFPASVFSNESTLHMRWPKYWSFSLASFLPKNTQDWSPLEWTGWISLQSKGLSRIFSSTTIQKHFSSVLSLLYGPTLTSIHDYWKHHSFDYMYLCQQSNISAF